MMVNVFLSNLRIISSLTWHGCNTNFVHFLLKAVSEASIYPTYRRQPDKSNRMCRNQPKVQVEWVLKSYL